MTSDPDDDPARRPDDADRALRGCTNGHGAPADPDRPCRWRVGPGRGRTRLRADVRRRGVRGLRADRALRHRHDVHGRSVAQDRARSASRWAVPSSGSSRSTASALPAGEIGEVQLRGPSVIPGYWQDAQATAEAIDADDWLATGDVGYVDDEGYLFLVDRKKELIIRGGYNVYPREVEEVLYGHPDVLEAAVVGVPHDRLGEEVAALVVPRPGATPDPDEPAHMVEGTARGLQVPADRGGRRRPPARAERQDPQARDRPRSTRPARPRPVIPGEHDVIRFDRAEPSTRPRA